MCSTTQAITDEILGCIDCGKGYKIGPLEYTLLEKLNLHLPHICPLCRTDQRFTRLNPIHLWKRNCAKCNIEVSTAFAPERPEIIYCEKCYQQEFV